MSESPPNKSVEDNASTQNESKEVTLQSLESNTDQMNALVKFFGDRGQVFNTRREYLDEFMSEYRYVHTNTYGTFRFVNYLEDLEETPENEKYLNTLGELYNTIDTEVDQVFGENATLGERASAVGQYIGYAIADPINIAATILGATGVGAGAGAAIKAGASGLSRTAIKAFVNKSLASKMAKGAASKTTSMSKAGRIASGAAAGAALELPVATYQEKELQGAEVILKTRDELNWADLASSVAFRTAFAGGFGAVGGALSKPATKAESIKADAKKVIDNKPVNISSKAPNLSEGLDKIKETTKKDYDTTGMYVKSLKSPKDLTDDYDPMGFVLSAPVNGKVTVRYLSKNFTSTDSPSKLDIVQDVKDLKALSADQATKEALEYVEKAGRGFLGRDDVVKGRNKLKDLGLVNEGDDIDIITDKIRNTDLMDRLTGFLSETVRKSPNIVTKMDIRNSATENFATVLEEIKLSKISNPEDFSVIAEDFANKGISLEDLQDVTRAYFSTSGNSLRLANRLSSKLIDKLAPAGSFRSETIKGKPGTTKTPELDSLARVLAEQTKLEQKSLGRLGTFVDIWRSFMVVQPATTIRNIAGSAAKFPGEALNQFIDNNMDDLAAEVLGYEKPKSISKREVFNVWSNVRDGLNSSDITKLISEEFPEVQRLIFDVHDDQLGKTPDSKIGKAFNSLSRFFNTLNIAQDRVYKSAGFLAELDNQVKLKRNRGMMSSEDAELIDGLEDLLRNNRWDLLDDTMVSKSIQSAYRLTYQSRRAGDDMSAPRAVQGIVNNFQKWMNENSAIKLIMPFPNFFINSLVYSYNRGLVLPGIYKYGKGKLKLRGMRSEKAIKETAEKRKELYTISEQTLALEAKKTMTDQEKELLSTLQGKADTITKEFMDREKALNDVGKGATESIEGAAWLITAALLKESMGNDTIYEVQLEDGTTVDTKPMFPLSAYMFITDTAKRYLDDDLPVRETFYKDLSEFLGGPSIRGNADRVITEISDVLQGNLDGENDPEAYEKAGKIFGGLLGHMMSPFATPLRPIQDVVKTVGGREDRVFRDRRQQKDVFGEEFSREYPLLSGVADETIKGLVQGTYLEKKLFPDTPVKYSPTKEGATLGPPAPLFKQIYGMNINRDKGPIMREINRLGIDKRFTSVRSNAPEYDNTVNRVLAIVEDDIISSHINSQEYQKLSEEDKKIRLRGFYRGSNKSSLPPEYRKAFDKVARQKDVRVPNNFIDLSKKLVDKFYPVLSEYKKFKDIPSSDRARALKAIKKEYKDFGKSLKYKEEYSDPEYASRLSNDMKFITEIHEKIQRQAKPSDLIIRKTAAKYMAQ